MADETLDKIPAVRLYKGDKEKLTLMYPKIGYNKAIREIVRKHIKSIEQLAQEPRQ